jgi:hypothetical protein
VVTKPKSANYYHPGANYSQEIAIQVVDPNSHGAWQSQAFPIKVTYQDNHARRTI